MGDPWGIGSLRGREKPNIKQIVKKWPKNLKNRQNLKKYKKSDFFLTENGLKCIRNPTKDLLQVNNLSKKKT